jgi:hypothetical protein
MILQIFFKKKKPQTIKTHAFVYRNMMGYKVKHRTPYNSRQFKQTFGMGKAYRQRVYTAPYWQIGNSSSYSGPSIFTPPSLSLQQERKGKFS